MAQFTVTIQELMNNSAGVSKSIENSISKFRQGQEVFAETGKTFFNISNMNEKILDQIKEVREEMENIASTTKDTARLSDSVLEASIAVSTPVQSFPDASAKHLVHLTTG